MVAAMRFASRTTDGDAPVSRSGDQGSAASAGSCFSGGPDFDEPGMARAIGDMPERHRCRAEARRPLRVGKDAVHGRKQRLHRAERQRERNAPPGEPRPVGALREVLTHGGEHPGRGALEAVDRLLLVADGEHRARFLARTAAGEEFLGERADHQPLRGARILRLVDQDVVEPSVQLVEHPFHGAGRTQQACRPADQVVEIQLRLPRLDLRIALHHGPAEPHQGQGGIEKLQPAARVVVGHELMLRALEQGSDIGMLCGKLLVISDCLGSPPPVRNTLQSSRMRPAALPAANAAPILSDARTSLTAPAASTSRTRASSASENRWARLSSVASRLASAGRSSARR